MSSRRHHHHHHQNHKAVAEALGPAHALPEQVQKYYSQMMQGIIELEKEGYDDTLVPFSQRADQMKIKGQEFIYEIYSQLRKAHEVLKRELEHEETANPNVPSDAHFSCWEEASKRLREKMQSPEYEKEEPDMKHSMQEQCGMSDAFMKRVYDVANRLMDEKKFEEAGDVFMFLRYLNPLVFEYWLGEATCLHERGQFLEAINIYGMSAILQPKNPYLFFQIANCLYQLHETAASLEAVKICISYAEHDEKRIDLLKQATEVLHALELQNAK